MFASAEVEELGRLVSEWCPVDVHKPPSSTTPSTSISHSSATPSSSSSSSSSAQSCYEALASLAEDERRRAAAGGGSSGAAAAAAAADPLDAHVAVLSRHRDRCGHLGTCVQSMLSHLERVEAKHRAVSTTTHDFLGHCRTLLDDQSRLQDAVRQIEAPLRHFDELGRLGKLLGLDLSEEDAAQSGVGRGDGGGGAAAAQPGGGGGYGAGGYIGGGSGDEVVALHPESDEFAGVLGEVDACVAFFLDHPHYYDAVPYTSKFQSLQIRGLTLVRNVVVSTFEATTSAIQNSGGGGGGGGGGANVEGGATVGSNGVGMPEGGAAAGVDAAGAVERLAELVCRRERGEERGQKLSLCAVLCALCAVCRVLRASVLHANPYY